MTNVNSIKFIKISGFKNHVKYIDRITTLTDRSKEDIYCLLYANKRSLVPWLLIDHAYRLCILYLRKHLGQGISVDPQRTFKTLFPFAETAPRPARWRSHKPTPDLIPRYISDFHVNFFQSPEVSIVPPQLPKAMTVSAVGL